MYTMFAFFTGLGFFFFWKAWSRDRWSDWLLFSLSMTAAFYTHSLAIFILLAIDVFCLTQLSQLKEHWKGLIAAHAAIFLLFLPWALMMFQQLPRLQNEFAGSEQTIATLIETLVVFLFGYSLQPNMIPVALFFALVLIAFILLALWHLFRRKGGDLPGILLALCISVIPVIGVFLMSYVTPVFVIRRLLPASLGLILLASWTIIKAKPKWINYAAGASVVVLMALSLVNYYQHPDDLKIPFHKIIEELQLEVNENAVFVTRLTPQP
jgi:hypothetical protein